MVLGIAWDHAQQDDSIVGYVDDLREGRISVVVADHDVATPLDRSTNGSVVDVAVSQAVGVDPHVPDLGLVGHVSIVHRHLAFPNVSPRRGETNIGGQPHRSDLHLCGRAGEI